MRAVNGLDFLHSKDIRLQRGYQPRLFPKSANPTIPSHDPHLASERKSEQKEQNIYKVLLKILALQLLRSPTSISRLRSGHRLFHPSPGKQIPAISAGWFDFLAEVSMIPRRRT